MFLNVDQLEKQLDKEEFQEIGSMTALKVLETQFQKFIKSRIYLDDDEYYNDTQKSIDKRALHKREYDSRVNERKMLTTEQNVDTSKALDARTKSKKQDTSSRSGNNAHVDDAYVRPIYDEELMTEFERPRISKQWFASQVDVKHVLSKPVTPHYLPKVPESAIVKPNHVITSSEYRKSSKNIPRFSSNDMIHNHYIEARKKTQEKVPTGKIITSSTTTIDSELPHGSNTDITNLYECIQTLDSSAGTSINVQEEQNLDLSAGTPSNLKKERTKACIKENVISGRPRIHKDGDGDALITAGGQIP
ncbi:hypothetical protein Tco_0157157 [Tanacetum coccineum]